MCRKRFQPAGGAFSIAAFMSASAGSGYNEEVAKSFRNALGVSANALSQAKRHCAADRADRGVLRGVLRRRNGPGANGERNDRPGSAARSGGLADRSPKMG